MMRAIAFAVGQTLAAGRLFRRLCARAAGFFEFHCRRQPPNGHRTDPKVKHVALRKTPG
jgi:hypothetical protein